MPRQSFIPIAPGSDFTLENLPYGIIRPKRGGAPRAAVAVGEFVLDLSVIEEAGYLTDAAWPPQRVFDAPVLNPFMALGRPAWRHVRTIVQHLLDSETPDLRDNALLRARALLALTDVEVCLPVAIGDYTDFYASYHHAHNVGSMLRGPDNALMPNWKYLPVAYHGRSSSIVVSGTPIRRPQGQIKPPEGARPIYAASRSVDFELEMGFFIGTGNELGEPIPVDDADEHIFGLILVNDWSARDIQTWEYQPLGPFLAKNFATSVSPWVVSMEALEPFRRPLPAQDPAPLAYLARANDWTYDIHLEVALQTSTMGTPQVIAHSNFQNLYWSINQQLAHHTINGCNLRTGDLLASGTISGEEPTTQGCLLELTRRGACPLALPDGQTRGFLEDGDRVTFHAWCGGHGCRVGWGTCTGELLPALPI